MRIGITAIEAMVSESPLTASTPKVRPVAARATRSGTSLRRERKTIPSVIAITRAAAMSRTRIDREMESVSSSIRTGTPVTS